MTVPANYGTEYSRARKSSRTLQNKCSYGTVQPIC